MDRWGWGTCRPSPVRPGTDVGCSAHVGPRRSLPPPEVGAGRCPNTPARPGACDVGRIERPEPHPPSTVAASMGAHCQSCCHHSCGGCRCSDRVAAGTSATVHARCACSSRPPAIATSTAGVVATGNLAAWGAVWSLSRPAPSRDQPTSQLRTTEALRPTPTPLCCHVACCDVLCCAAQAQASLAEHAALLTRLAEQHGKLATGLDDTQELVLAVQGTSAKQFKVCVGGGGCRIIIM